MKAPYITAREADIMTDALQGAQRSSSLPTVQALFDKAFDAGRPPRSDAYKAGVRAKLSLVIDKRVLPCPYAQGTAEMDAFFAGTEEARQILWAAA